MTGEPVARTTRFALAELCERCGIPETTVTAYVAEGVIEPEGPGGDAARWRFSEVTVVRALKARRLERDLGVNPAGAALALDLMERIEALEARLRRMDRDG